MQKTKTKVKFIRFTPEQFALIQQVAEKNFMSTTEYIRQSVLRQANQDMSSNKEADKAIKG